MLKGYVFNQQIFPSQIFALFINTFLNGQNGVSNNYLNGMAVSYSGSNVTISSGAVCIQGRFLGEDSTVTLNAGTSDLYCKLVIEINLDNTNTAGELNQANYKIVTSASSYPELTQTNIVKNNSGIYQYELARFKTSVNGITNFQDMRTFLDFESIYQEIRDKLASIEDGSAFLLKSNLSSVTGQINVTGKQGDKYVLGQQEINFPAGFTPDNCVAISISLAPENNTNFPKSFGTLSSYGYSVSLVNGGIGRNLIFRKNTNDMLLTALFQWDNLNLDSDKTYVYNYQILLMKISD